jgi:hypothetical protein
VLKDGGVYSAPVSNLASVTLIATGGNYSQPHAITADANFVYFSASGVVYRCAVGGCGNSPTQIDSGSGPIPLVNTAQAVYWGDGFTVSCLRSDATITA